jgi:hypothetical protein
VRRAQLLFLALVGSLVVLVSCTQRDGLYCDDTTPCTDPARPFCDINGSFPASSGVGRTCIADPNSTAIDAGMPDAEVTNCSLSSECGSAMPICTDELCASCVPGSSGDADCAAKDSAQPICGGDGRCYECTRSFDCTSVNMPVCDLNTKTCKGCDDHEQCGSGVCDMGTGSCVADVDVIYVDVTLGSDGASCGSGPEAAACRHLGGFQGAFSKVQGTRRTISMAPGNYILQASNLQVTMYGNGAHIFPVASLIGPALDVFGNSDLVLHDLVLRNGNGGGTGMGVSCLSSEIEFHNVIIRDNDNAGVASMNCSLSFFESTVQSSLREGLQLQDSLLLFQASKLVGSSLLGLIAEDSSLVIERSTISNNSAGGLHLTRTDFVIENSVIAKNGNKTVNPADFAGGVVVRNTLSLSPQIIRHSTIVDNESPSILSASGIDCGLGATSVSCTSSIVVGNEKPSGGSQIGGNCDARFSNITGILIGQGNISVAPSFVSPPSGDYHLAAGSAGINLADPSSPTTVDIDNQARPVGGGYDMGADERQQ